MYEDPEPFKTEAEMCAQFISEIGDDWTAYAETAGWDILLVHETGFQIGIEAKLKLNGKVLAQALEENDWHGDDGPDCRAVLVPKAAGYFYPIAAYIGLTVITIRPTPSDRFHRALNNHTHRPRLPVFTDKPLDWHGRGWTEMCPTRRCKLPEYVPDVSAGIAAPVQLTAWKIAAIKIAVTLELRGYVTREDFRNHKIDFRRWTPRETGWLAPSPDGFIAGPEIPDFKAQHPSVYDQIKKDAPKWLKEVLPVQRQQRQESML